MNKLTTDEFNVIEKTDDPRPWDGKTWNSAHVMGAPSAAFDALMGQEAQITIGKVYPDGDKAGTNKKGWKPTAGSWRDFLESQLTHHRKGDRKDGSGFVLGVSGNGERKKDSMREMYAIGIDIDVGAKLDDVIQKVAATGYAAVVYTSFRHMMTTMPLNYSKVIRHGDVTDESVKAYLRKDKPELGEDFIAEVSVASARHDTGKEIMVLCNCPPIHKMRVIFILSEPVDITTLTRDPLDGPKIWKAKVKALGAMLGVLHDTACEDPSRFFFGARHPEGAKWRTVVFRGRPLAFDQIVTDADNPYSRAGGGINGGESTIPEVAVELPDGQKIDVTAMYRSYGKRWQLADIMALTEAYHDDGDTQDKVIVRCAFHDEHSDQADDEATIAWNPDGHSHGYAAITCQHSCKDRYHTVDHLGRYIADGILDPRSLEKPDFMLPVGEGAEGPFNRLTPDEAAEEEIEQTECAATVRDTLLALVEGFDLDTTEAEVRGVMRQAIEAGADKAAQGRLKAAIASKTPIKPHAFNALWKDESAAARKKQKPKGDGKTGDIEACHIKADFPDQLAYARRRIVEANAVCPRLFQFGGAYATADTVRHRVRMEDSRDTMNYVLQDVTRWEVTDKVGEEYVNRKVAPPESVIRVLYKDHVFADTLPELLAVPSTPFFDAEGRLVIEDGYHAGAKVYLAKVDLVLPGVSREPSDDDVAEAKRLLVEEVLADFPLGGMDRDQIVGTLTGDAPNAHAVAHAVAMTLLPFCRDMIEGPTPGHVFTKPGPGTGASLLVDVLSTIASGAPAPAMTLPGKPEEIGKTVSAVLAAGAPFALFDNIDKSIASGELASAMTAPTYQARILGKTQLVMVPVRVVWVFTANNIEASREILRRFVLIPLDAGVPDPEKRTPAKGWRHANLRRWVTENRPMLVWACLTLIQNWVAKGMEKASEPSLASYEDWARVMGGILTAANFHGFLEGQDAERAKAADSTEDGLLQLLNVLSQYPTGTMFRAGGNRAFAGVGTVSVMDVLNGSSRPKVKDSEGKPIDWGDPDPIQINGWGYNSFDGAYKTSGKIGGGLKVLARKPYQIGGEVLTFKAHTDTRGGGEVYELVKKAA